MPLSRPALSNSGSDTRQVSHSDVSRHSHYCLDSEAYYSTNDYKIITILFFWRFLKIWQGGQKRLVIKQTLLFFAWFRVIKTFHNKSELNHSLSLGSSLTLVGVSLFSLSLSLSSFSLLSFLSFLLFLCFGLLDLSLLRLRDLYSFLTFLSLSSLSLKNTGNFIDNK